MKKERNWFSYLIFLSVALVFFVLNGTAAYGVGSLGSQTPINPAIIPQFVDAMPHFAGLRLPGAVHNVIAEETQQFVLPAAMYAALGAPFNLGTYAWGYTVDGFGPHWPGFTVEAQRGVATTFNFFNNLVNPFMANGALYGGQPGVPDQIGIIPYDQTLHWADPLGQMDLMLMTPYTGPIPVAYHMHGAEVPSEFDGGPEQWFTPNGLRGLAYRTASSAGTPAVNGATYIYPMVQEPAAIWFHDHALGATRLNVYAGMAAFCLLRDWTVERPNLPGGPADVNVQDLTALPPFPTVYKPEIEIAIQDRMFDTNGQLYFPAQGINPMEHPWWIPEFVGDIITVNSKTWPYLNVEPRRYRFRLLDGSNARFYELALNLNAVNGRGGPAIWVIGGDGGLLDVPVKIASPKRLIIAPGERYDLIIDFKGYAGKTIYMTNTAPTPYPGGAPVTAGTTDRIMQFRVGRVVSGGPDPSYNPATGLSPRLTPRPQIPLAPVVTRQLTLNEVMGMGGPLEILVNNTKWSGRRPTAVGPMGGDPIPGSVSDGVGNWMTELPRVGTTEVWEIINTTADAHPMHLHLVQFQLLSRQKYNVAKFTTAYAGAFPGGTFNNVLYPAGTYIPGYGPPLAYGVYAPGATLGGNPNVNPFLKGAATAPLPQERGWEDTVIMYPGQVSRILVRWAKQDGTPYSFDATGVTPISFGPDGATLTFGPGYVWHCHIVDHEDNEMMRPYRPIP